MPKFSKNNIDELNRFLYDSCVHDAKLESIKYNGIQDSTKIELFNPISNTRIYLTLLDTGVALATKGVWPGDRETILSLTVEEDFSYLQNYISGQHECTEEYLYLLFQTFSGDELHVISKEIIIEMVGGVV